MSPVIYRPGGSGPEEPERPDHTAATSEDRQLSDSELQTDAPAWDGDAWDGDEDPDISDDELDAELVDDLIEEPQATGSSGGRGRLRDLGRRLRRGDLDDESTQLAPADAGDDALTPEPPLMREPAPRPADFETDPAPEAPAPDEPAPDEPAQDEPAPDETVSEDSVSEDSVPDLLEPVDAVGESAAEPTIASPQSAGPPRYTPARPRYTPLAAPRADDVPVVDETIDDAEPGSAAEPDVADETAPVEEPAHDPAWRTPAPLLPPPLSAESVPPEPELDPEAGPEPSVATTTVGGRAVSSRGRGLSGMTVSLVDASERIIASVGAGRHGQFLFPEVVDGDYRIVVTDDIDGDFATTWFEGEGADDSTVVMVRSEPLAGVNVEMRSAAAILADVALHDHEAVVNVAVTDRASGHPTSGVVQIVADRFGTTIPLVNGRAQISINGGENLDELPKRIKLSYPGDDHSAPVSRSVRLR